MENGKYCGAVNKRAEIDTSPPFRSVKEAVSLFGERVLAGEVYAAGKFKEMNPNSNGPSHETTSPAKFGGGSNDHHHVLSPSELEETKQSLEKAREETKQMANYLSSLKEELEQTKRELQELKEDRLDHLHQQHQQLYSPDQQMMDLEINEDLKYVEDNNKNNTKQQQGYTPPPAPSPSPKRPPPPPPAMSDHVNVEHSRAHKVTMMNLGIREDHLDTSNMDEFQKKRYVTFSNPPLSEVLFMSHNGAGGTPGGVGSSFTGYGHGHGPVLERHPSLKKKKKKPLIPLIGGIFGRKKNNSSSTSTTYKFTSSLSP